MGAAQSHLQTLWLAAKLLLQLNTDFQALLRRASAPPGLPVPHPTRSYWLADPPYPSLVEARSPALPPDADIVIVGSGITGAAVARSILLAAPAPAPRVVVLEARTLCSGATGRNGGHIKPSPHEAFAQLRKRGVGAERAAALVRFQLAHLGVLTGLCKGEGQAWVDAAECREVETVDFYLDEKGRENAFSKVRELREWVPEIEIEMWDGEAARKKFETNQFVQGAISYKAGALWPFRLVSCVWKDLLDKFERNLSLETDTAVQYINTAPVAKGIEGEPFRAYGVETSRGTIRCDHVVHATNSFAPQLIPGLQGKLTGVLAHMSAQRPSGQIPDLNGARSWSAIYEPGFDYVSQRPTSVDGTPGDIMLGGGFARSKEKGADVVGVWDDSRLDPLTVAHISGIMPAMFGSLFGDVDQGAEGAKVKQVWSGILGVTGDMLPLVGRLDTKLTGRQPKVGKGSHSDDVAVQPGEWISAGYCGEGMVWAWLSGTALGLMLLGSEAVDLPQKPGFPGGKMVDWFPKELEPSVQRIKRAGLENLADFL